MKVYIVDFKGVAVVEANSKGEAEDFVLICASFPECEEVEASAVDFDELEF